MKGIKEIQVTPLMWVDSQLDNVMASLPELAIWYHHNDVVQGYDILKTNEIFLLKYITRWNFYLSFSSCLAEWYFCFEIFAR